jgi:hypothetical protein
MAHIDDKGTDILTIVKPKYRCPAHGEVEFTMTVSGVRNDLDGHYCMICWVLLMQRSGVHKVTKIEPK